MPPIDLLGLRRFAWLDPVWTTFLVLTGRCCVPVAIRVSVGPVNQTHAPGPPA